LLCEKLQKVNFRKTINSKNERAKNLRCVCSIRTPDALIQSRRLSARVVVALVVQSDGGGVSQKIDLIIDDASLARLYKRECDTTCSVLSVKKDTTSEMKAAKNLSGVLALTWIWWGWGVDCVSSFERVDIELKRYKKDYREK